MRATRAYIASFGTTSVLVASSLALLIVVSAIVAFNGWPESGIADRVESTEVSTGGSSVFEVAGPSIVAADAAPAAAAVASEPAGAAQAPGAPGIDTGGVRGERRRDDSPTGPGGPPPALVEGPGDSPPAAPAPGLLERLTQPPNVQTGEVTTGVASGTQEVTGSVGNSVNLLSPELGRIVAETGKVLSDAVRALPSADSSNLGG